MLVTFVMTLIYLMIIFIVILFSDCYDYMLNIARLSYYSNMKSYNACSNVHWVSGEHCVSVVLIQSCFLTVALYILGHVVDRGHDKLIESSGVHSPNVGQLVELYFYGRQALFLIFLSNIHHA